MHPLSSTPGRRLALLALGWATAYTHTVSIAGMAFGTVENTVRISTPKAEWLIGQPVGSG